MYKFFIRITLLSLMSCSSQEQFKNENFALYEEEGKDDVWMDIRTDKLHNYKKGKLTGYFPTGEIFSEIYILDSFSNRDVKYYDYGKHNKTTSFRTDTVFKIELIDGYFREYKGINRSLTAEGLLRKGKKDGYWKFYNHLKEGMIKESAEFKNGILDGINKKYNEDGFLLYSFRFKNGVKHGLCELWYSTGSLKKKLTYVNGKKHGEEEHYYKNRKFNYRCVWSNDTLKGNVLFYDTLGNKLDSNTKYNLIHEHN